MKNMLQKALFVLIALNLGVLCPGASPHDTKKLATITIAPAIPGIKSAFKPAAGNSPSSALYHQQIPVKLPSSQEISHLVETINPKLNKFLPVNDLDNRTIPTLNVGIIIHRAVRECYPELLGFGELNRDLIRGLAGDILTFINGLFYRYHKTRKTRYHPFRS